MLSGVDFRAGRFRRQLFDDFVGGLRADGNIAAGAVSGSESSEEHTKVTRKN